jgi:site-specific recombinase XerD
MRRATSRTLTSSCRLTAIRLYEVRHTNAGEVLQAGVDLKVVSERLGHAQPAISAGLTPMSTVASARMSPIESPTL